MELTVGSLFAGVGGLEQGLEQAGWETRWQVEKDKHASSVLARWWPEVPRWGDVCDVAGDELPPVDLVSFGSPCTDLSLAGRRQGLANEDGSGLFFEATRIITEMRAATAGMFPTWGLWENVGGAFSSNDGRDFAAVLDELANIGASVIEWGSLDARNFGVPQRRFRVFVIAYFGSDPEGLPDRILPLAGESMTTMAGTGNQLGLFAGDEARPSDALNPHVADDARYRWQYQGRWQADGVAWQCHGKPMADTGPQDSPLLVDILEPLERVDPKYLMSKKAAVGVLRRAVRRQRALPVTLFNALLAMAGDDAAEIEGLDVLATMDDPVTASTVTASLSHGADVRAAQAGHLVSVQTAPPVSGTLGGGSGVRGRCDDLDRSGAFVPISVAENQRGELRITDYTPAVQAGGGKLGQSIPAVLQQPVSLQDCRGLDKNQNGRGWSEEGVMFTLDTTGAQGVAQADPETPVAYPAAVRGRGGSTELEMGEPNVGNTLRAGDGGSSRSQLVVTPAVQVRRLMPVETERLMGWADGHTEFDAAGVTIADTHRYRMCGNGVVSSCSKWIGEHIAAADPAVLRPAA